MDNEDESHTPSIQKCHRLTAYVKSLSSGIRDDVSETSADRVLCSLYNDNNMQMWHSHVSNSHMFMPKVQILVQFIAQLYSSPLTHTNYNSIIYHYHSCFCVSDTLAGFFFSFCFFLV